MDETIEIEHFELHDEIARLEARIEELAAKIENCRKFVRASRVAVVLSGLLLAVWFAGPIRLGPEVLGAAVVLGLGGIVLMGSSRSTGNEAAAQLVAVEARRAELIGQIELHVVGDLDGAGSRQ